NLEAKYQFPRDTTAKILTSGILGEQYVGLEAGGDGVMLKSGDRLRLTQSAVVLENLISQFLFSKAAEGQPEGKNWGSSDPSLPRPRGRVLGRMRHQRRPRRPAGAGEPQGLRLQRQGRQLGAAAGGDGLPRLRAGRGPRPGAQFLRQPRRPADRRE